MKYSIVKLSTTNIAFTSYILNGNIFTLLVYMNVETNETEKIKLSFKILFNISEENFTEKIYKYYK